jgi:hypothetical protein
MTSTKGTGSSKPTPLMKVLHALPPTGARGFENLCALLLSKLTGARFFGARSGQQNGRDLDSDRASGWFVVVECKRYGTSTKLSERELIAEISIAHRREPTLDMWVLAATRGVDANVLQALHGHALDSGLDLQVLPCGTQHSPENMDFLCAAFAGEVIKYCKPAPPDVAALRTYLAAVKRRSDFKLQLQALRGAFDQANAGLPTFRTRINAALAEQLRTEAASRARLGNALAPGEATPLDVPRANATNAFVEFLHGTADPAKPRICAVIGEEGNGKSWAVASWVRSLLAYPEGPAVFWFKAADAGELAGLAELARKGASLLPATGMELLRLKLQRWFKRPGPPFCVVVLDGINERRDVAFWAQYILSLSVDANSKMVLVLTARPDSWKDLKARMRLPTDEIVVGEFDRDEFALAMHDQQRSTVERLWELGEVARKPRYLADALAYLKEGGSAQELTVERLYYESWSNRVRRRPDYPLGRGDFEGLLRRLARESEGRLATVDVLAGFATLDDPKPVLRELGSSGILRVEPDGTTKLSRHFLVEGLSLLLLDVLARAAGSLQDLRAQVGAFVHDTQQQPLTAQVCAAAAHKSVIDPSFSDDVTAALILELLDCQNAEQASIEGLLTLAGRKPNALARVAEVHWSTRETDTLVETAVLRSFIALANQAKSGDQVVNILSRWAGFVHEFGEGTSDIGDMRERRAARVHAVAPTLGVFPVTPDQSWTLTRIDNQYLLRLGRLALAVASFADRTTFFQPVLNCIVADQLMGAGRAGLCCWVLGSSRQSLDAQVEDALQRLETVTGLDAEQLRRARLVLLNAAASPRFSQQLAAARITGKQDPQLEALERAWRTPSLKELPVYLLDQTVPAHRKLDVAGEFAADTRASFPSAFVEDLYKMVDGLQLESRRIGRSRTLQDSSWEKMEPLLARLAPEKYAAKASEFLRSILHRNPESVLGLSFEVERYALLVSLPELDATRQVWERDYLKGGKLSDMDSQAEAELFEVLLGFMTGLEQAQQLARRGEEMRQYVKYERLFDVGLDKEQQRQLAAMATSDFATSSVLWLASQQKKPAADVWLPVIDRALAGTDALARGMALQTLWRFDASAQRLRVKALGKPDPRSARIEHFWTTLLLLERSDEKPGPLLDSCDLGSVASYLGHVSGPRRTELATDFAARVLIWLTKQLSPGASEAASIPVALHIPEAGTTHWPAVGVDWGLLDNTISFRSELSVWGGISPGDGTSLKDAFDTDKHDQLQRALIEALEQSQAVSDWGYTAAWSDETIEALLAVPQFDQRLEPLIQRALGQRRLRSVASFVSSLARVLLKKGDTRGFELVQHVQGDQPVRQVEAGNVDSLDVAFFSFPEADEARQHWLTRLEAATSDAQLLACCELLVRGNNQKWLRKQAEEDLGRNAPYYKRRGLLLLAGSRADGPTIEGWGSRLAAAECALEDVVAIALDYVHRLQNMEHWLTALTTAQDEVFQTCAAHLLVHCCDLRIWRLLRECKALERAPAYAGLLEPNRLKNASKEVLKERDKRLFGFQKYELDAHPWVKSEQGFSVTMRI